MPDQFWEMTLRELILQVRGFKWRQEQENWRMATVVATLMNPLRTVQMDPKKIKRSKMVSAADVLGRSKRGGSEKKATTPEAQKALFESLVKRTKHWGRRSKKPSPS